jgi:hypothetical protein
MIGTVEYKVITESNVKIQTLLNQWKHNYILEVTSCGVSDRHGLTVIIKRTLIKEFS